MRDVIGNAANPVDMGLDPRARMLRERAEAEERRAHALKQQRSDSNAPAARIRIWEELHHLVLPRDPAHRVLQVVADQTGLTLAEVQEAQRLRGPGTTPIPAF